MLNPEFYINKTRAELLHMSNGKCIAIDNSAGNGSSDEPPFTITIFFSGGSKTKQWPIGEGRWFLTMPQMEEVEIFLQSNAVEYAISSSTVDDINLSECGIENYIEDLKTLM